MDFKEYISIYKSNLLEDVVPFWANNSIDKEHGGYYTCLLRDGAVFDSDKFLWLQGRQVWLFSMLYNEVEKNEEWLDIALHGADFLEKYGRAENGHWYFSLTKEGKPLLHPYNVFSDCFATQAFGQLYKATNEERYAQIALNTFQNILQRQDNPKGQWTKGYPETRPLKNFALPMILCNLAKEIEHLLDSQMVREFTDKCIHEVMDVFYDASRGLILENVTPDGQFSDSFEGRLLNPGHAIEAMWFIMDIASDRNDASLIQRAKDITLKTLEYAWDKEHGGLYYFMDAKGYPPQQLEWDQKLWWVHIETLIALLKGYELTGDINCWESFEKVHEYTWNVFPDHEMGEWYGYLNRQGKPHLELKGGKWKGCYHVPRGLYQCWQVLEKLKAKNIK